MFFVLKKVKIHVTILVFKPFCWSREEGVGGPVESARGPRLIIILTKLPFSSHVGWHRLYADEYHS